MRISAAPGTESNRLPEPWKAEKCMTETESEKQSVEMLVSESDSSGMRILFMHNLLFSSYSSP